MQAALHLRGSKPHSLWPHEIIDQWVAGGNYECLTQFLNNWWLQNLGKSENIFYQIKINVIWVEKFKGEILQKNQKEELKTNNRKNILYLKKLRKGQCK